MRGSAVSIEHHSIMRGLDAPHTWQQLHTWLSCLTVSQRIFLLRAGCPCSGRCITQWSCLQPLPANAPPAPSFPCRLGSNIKLHTVLSIQSCLPPFLSVLTGAQSLCSSRVPASAPAAHPLCRQKLMSTQQSCLHLWHSQGGAMLHPPAPLSRLPASFAAGLCSVSDSCPQPTSCVGPDCKPDRTSPPGWQGICSMKTTLPAQLWSRPWRASSGTPSATSPSPSRSSASSSTTLSRGKQAGVEHLFALLCWHYIANSSRWSFSGNAAQDNGSLRPAEPGTAPGLHPLPQALHQLPRTQTWH